MAITIKLPFKKETKNMLQYQCEDDDKGAAAIPTIYVRKEEFEAPDWPPFLEVTVKGVSK
jgi:hypothetical protein